MSSKKSKGCLVASALWCAILAVLAVAYKLLVHPFFSEKLAEDTGSASQYQSEVRIAADSFSGYAVLRSDRIKNLLKREGIKLTILDDQADYAKRLNVLKEGDIDLAVFTIDYIHTVIQNWGITYNHPRLRYIVLITNKVNVNGHFWPSSCYCDYDTSTFSTRCCSG